MARRQRTKLSARQVELEKRSGRHSDGGGLYLFVDKSGAKRWLYIFRWRGRQPEMGLGPYPAVTLALARKAALEAEALVRAGKNPIDVRNIEKIRQSSIPTFAEFVDTTLPQLLQAHTNEKHKYQWKQTLRSAYCKPLLHKAVSEITTGDVLEVLEPIWVEKNPTATRLRERIERVLDAAKTKGYRDGENPARWKGHLSNILANLSKREKKHHTALPYDKVPEFMVQLQARDSMSARALEFIILTLVRAGNARNAKWEEIDFGNRLWTIKSRHYKTRKRDFRQPLSDQALGILEDMTRLRGLYPESPFIFPSNGGNRLSNMAFKALLVRMRRDNFVPHGFRSTFRDWVHECTEVSGDISRQCLGQKIGDEVDEAYLRSDALEKRRNVMHQWGEFTFSLRAKK